MYAGHKIGGFKISRSILHNNMYVLVGNCPFFGPLMYDKKKDGTLFWQRENWKQYDIV